MRSSPGAALEWLRSVALGWASDECLVWPFAQFRDGYGVCHWNGRMDRAHRVVLELSGHAPPSARSCALHSCDRRECVNPRHLRWGSNVENGADASMRGRLPRGERHANAKLTEADVRLIRAAAAVETPRVMARRFGVSKAAVQHVVNGKTWRHVV